MKITNDNKPHISIISSSIRTGRRSHRVALYFQNYLIENNIATTEILDLKACNFPIFEERLQYQKHPEAAVIEFVEKINASCGVIIVTPEYNGGYPAALKNVIDLLYDEWHGKPIAISTVSAGGFGGSQVITALQFVLWKMRAWTIPENFSVSRVQEAFDAEGNPTDITESNLRAEVFINQLLWSIQANKCMSTFNEHNKYSNKQHKN